MNKLNENLQIPEPYLSFLEAVENVPAIWAEHPLPDLPDLSMFSRKIAVTGFNAPKCSPETGNRIYISVEQILTHRDSGKLFKAINAPMWEIMDETWSYLKDFSDPTKLVEVDKTITTETPVVDPDDPENVQMETSTVTVKSFIKVPTVKYLKFLILNKKAHLVDLFEQYLSDFATAKASELEKL